MSTKDQHPLCQICRTPIRHRISPEQKAHGFCVLTENYGLRLLPDTLQEISTLQRPPLSMVFDIMALLMLLVHKTCTPPTEQQDAVEEPNEADDYRRT